ncbi:hypothetical protein LTR10_021040 [Elasticomyces elasticus]|uniref:Uncharacterized protein n=1 Tax=Exophiala sideris TaxID=1016849 RepID=A0ABR0JB18_9EURO|nr:hypothetical protein LTR10_021040 [Elasticomyces elasticus]KAK5027760.1 hypothetical protein LTS07_006635 [Exophiala sideris]KAK5037650.1 hypothetical protein LTR13_004809 [Exophiala sideris]KAK5059312.1 hypothetical protein LTR69_006602 [Exophiala sideris]KAK5183146.1 hypothetical protein LTR44_004857 [Eurotiomycetes sp. CCFEE 6388]
MPDISAVLASCKGLVTMDGPDGPVRLMHSTTKKYFESHGNIYIKPEAYVANMCLTYVLFNDFQDGPCDTVAALLERQKRYPLYSYVASYWWSHAYETGADYDETSRDLVLKFLERRPNLESAMQADQLRWQMEFEEESQSSGRGHGYCNTLYTAAEFQFAGIVEYLLARGHPTDYIDGTGRTALWHAASVGSTEIAELFLGRNPGLASQADQNGVTPLHAASDSDVEDMVLLLLKAGVEVDARDSLGRTPLLRAAENGFDESASLLIQFGADIHAKDNRGKTSLHLAIPNGEPLIKLLLDNGADADPKDNNGATPLNLALSHDWYEPRLESLVRLLLEYGVDDTAVSNAAGLSKPVAKQIPRMSHDCGADIETEGYPGMTLLTSAAQQGKVSLSKHLLGNHSQPLTIFGKERATLVPAEEQQDHNIVRLLVARGVHPDSRDSLGKAPLAVTAARGDLHLAQFLLESGAVVDAGDNEGRSPIFHAAIVGCADMVRFLIEKGSSVDSRDKEGMTPLIYAAAEHPEYWFTSRSEVVEVLLENGAELGARDGTGRTALFHALASGKDDIASRLVAEGASVESTDINGLTPLQRASQIGDFYALKALLDKGAALGVTDVKKRLALLQEIRKWPSCESAQ